MSNNPQTTRIVSLGSDYSVEVTDLPMGCMRLDFKKPFDYAYMGHLFAIAFNEEETKAFKEAVNG